MADHDTEPAVERALRRRDRARSRNAIIIVVLLLVVLPAILLGVRYLMLAE